MSEKVSFWLKDAGERVASTLAEVAAAAAALYVLLESTGLMEVDWTTVAAAGPLVVVATVVKVLASYHLGDKGTAAVDRDPARLVDEEFHTDHEPQEG